MLVVERTDLLRVVVQVPDLDVPWIKPRQSGDRGDRCAARRGLSWHRRPFRRCRGCPVAHDARRNRSNPIQAADFRQGMYGRVTIKLRAGGIGLVIPASCLGGAAEGRERRGLCRSRWKGLPGPREDRCGRRRSLRSPPRTHGRRRGRLPVQRVHRRRRCRDRSQR